MSEPARTERGLDRLVNFSDATVAIAITLLVLPLVDLAADLRDGQSTGDLLAEHWPALVAFVVTFWVIAGFWRAHHRVFEHVHTYDERVLHLNFVWLISIVFLPFAANLLNHGIDGDRLSFAVYIGTMLVTSLSLAAIELRLMRHPELVSTPLPNAHKGLVASGLLALALVLAVAFPNVGMFWVLLLLFQGQVGKLVDRRRTAPIHTQ